MPLHGWQITVLQVLPAIAIPPLLLLLFLTACFCYRRRRAPSLHGYNNAGNLGITTVSSSSQEQRLKGRSFSAKSGWRLFFSVRGEKDPFESSALKRAGREASVWRLSYPIKTFEWSENPAHVAEAMEHGWAAFAFTYTATTPSGSLLSHNASHHHHQYSHSHHGNHPQPRDLICGSMSCTTSGACRGNQLDNLYEPEISWEMGHTSQHLQKLWLNPSLPTATRKENALAFIQALQSVLPLPGPPVASRFFPQEGYFEITILAEGCEYNADMSRSSLAENEHAKLISKKPTSEKFNVLMSEHHQHMNPDVISDGKLRSFIIQQGKDIPSAPLHHDDNGDGGDSPQHFFGMEKKSRHHGKDSLQIIALGMAAGGAPPFRLPGHDMGSVGFLSNGRVYINGALHVEQEPGFPAIKRVWGAVKSTVGCGFDPLSRKVFFTVDGEMVYELVTESKEFGKPLYPTVASNYDVTVLVNFGQIAFEYALANTRRVSIPYLHRPFSRSIRNGSMNEDSGDLFSMGRIDSQWLSEVGSPDGDDLQHRQVLSEAESDLFEIVLECSS